MVLMHEVARRATTTALRENPEGLLVDLDACMEGDGDYAEQLATVTIGELRDEALGLPPVRLHVARALKGAEFDETVHTVLLEVGRFVRPRYLRSRLGGPRWKLQAALGRLVEDGLAERVGVTSDAAYRGGGVMAGDPGDDAANDGIASLQGAAFGRYLREVRTERGLSREEFSSRSGLAVAEIEGIEKGHTTALDSLRKICLGLDMPMSTLFMKFDDRDAAAIQEISWLLRGRDRRLIALATQIIRDLVHGMDAMVDSGS